MSREDRGSFALPLTAGAVLGALGGGLAYGLLWLASHPGEPIQSLLAQVEAGFHAREPALFRFAAFGALVGLGLVAMTTGPVLARRAGRAVWNLAVVALGGLVGALLGVAAYVFLWLQASPGTTVEQAAGRVPDALRAPGDPLLPMVLAGGLIGLSVGAYLAGDVGRRLTQAITGASTGALGGLVMYSIAYVAIFYPQLPDTASDLLRFGEAVHSFTVVEFVFVALGAGLGALMSRYSWQFYGLVTLASLSSVVLGYVGYTLSETLPDVPGPYDRFAVALFVAEAVSLGMVVLYSFYTIDVSTRKRWRRRPADAPFSPYYVPKVAIHVPTFNEPFDLVEATLRSLLALDYPRDRLFLVVADDSSKPEHADPLRKFCEANGIVYLHRAERTGYKAGALNEALRVTPGDVDVIGVLDADYQVTPRYLAETVGYFVADDLGWVQTPQDYRNQDQSFLTRQYYVADAFFYRTVLPSRNEENTIIFCGTMGLLRAVALRDVGGWDERFLSEDAELSVRLLGKGWDSLYVNSTYGRGLIPPTFDGYKKQMTRWAYGGGQILRHRVPRIVFGPYSRRQAFDYFVGSAHWFEGLFILLIALSLLSLGLSDLLGLPLVTHHSREVLLIGLLPAFFIVDGLTRLHLVMRQTMPLSFLQSLGVLGMWWSVKFSNARAALLALVGFKKPFVRTPKGPDRRFSRPEAFVRALRLAPFETFMGSLLLATAAALAVKIYGLGGFGSERGWPKLLLLLWTSYYALIFYTAPLYAYKSFATFRPEIEPQPAPARVRGTAV